MDTIRNFVQLTDRIGTSGQPSEAQFGQIAKAGYQVVINLAMPDHQDAVACEEQRVTMLGMGYIHIPVPFDAPEPAHIKRFCEVMQQHKHERIWVHCIMNYRVAAFMFHYLHKVVGLDEAAARSPMFATWQPDEVWSSLLKWSAKEMGL
ncbi:MAG: phosphatase [Zetaproteobacteria bacterium CG_4_9_14_3_um_filter_49_83]|nr:MAG: hypothetical protein AUJ56_03375 [Zetaproteobacteria bacterium CG1_02_49_23]PIQ33060.1 MAG: phosphatase [Zetaproteobacteria bacterium CG17_big_fil_post_rev_8_21_14_2_50_50_13]PIV31376.1 MAG: phosphatase [Zetaproteobacteria bacterium CG02_land_8_20_14_3_00_50_9]PIY56335.1 MAG: phosphatase [Zetaproteobacteria bacterium CG_4_10_14_0_8_um_filter_49_80]PJA35760.1 MAG: phosphatase [Zetaproteobacteria bacterium CG_4_9_14_3_um_filter_49_83]